MVAGGGLQTLERLVKWFVAKPKSSVMHRHQNLRAEIRVPMDKPLDAELVDEEESAAASLAEAQILGSDHGVVVHGETVRARSIGEAIVEQAKKRDVDLVMISNLPEAWEKSAVATMKNCPVIHRDREPAKAAMQVRQKTRAPMVTRR